MKRNFVDEAGKSYGIGRNFVCAHRGRRTQFKLIHVLSNDVQLKEFEVRARVKMEEGVFIRKF